MNDFPELEADLKKLRPVAPSAGLARRIEQALQSPLPTAGVIPQPKPRAHGWWLFALGLTGAAAVLVIGLTFFDEPSRPMPVASATPSSATTAASSETASATGFRPSGLTQVVYSRRDDGVIFTPNDSEQPRRRLRYATRETMQWRNPQTGASVRVSYPAEQVVLMPVAFQ